MLYFQLHHQITTNPNFAQVLVHPQFLISKSKRNGADPIIHLHHHHQHHLQLFDTPKMENFYIFCFQITWDSKLGKEGEGPKVF